MEQVQKLDRANVQNVSKLSPFQESLLSYYVRHDDDTYFVKLTLFMEGEIDVDLCNQTWQHLVDQHQMLRTIFRWKKIDSPVQITLRKVDFSVSVHDLEANGLSFENTKEFLQKHFPIRDLDLEVSPFKVYLFRLSKDRFAMQISSHHILFDGWSHGLLLQGFFDAYANLTKGEVPKVSAQPLFTDYVKQTFTSSVQQKGFVYWKDYLQDMPKMSLLQDQQTDGPARMKRTSIMIGPAVMKRLENVAREQRVTMAGLFYTSWGILLRRLTNSEKIVFGTTVSGRNVPFKDIEHTVGLFINTVPLILNSGGDPSFTELLQKLNEDLLSREPHLQCGFADLKKEMVSELDQEPFESLVVVENYPINVKDFNKIPGLKPHSYALTDFNNFNLYLVVDILMGGCELTLCSDQNRYSARLVDNLLRKLSTILDQVSQNPQIPISQLSIISDQERTLLLEDFIQIKSFYKVQEGLHQLFVKQAAATPDHTAICFQGQEVSYRKLDEMSNQLANYLAEKGISQTNIAVVMHTSVEMIASLLGILKSRNAYVPIDPEQPANRTQWQLQDADVRTVISEPNIVQNLTGQGIEVDFISWDNEAVEKSSKQGLSMDYDSNDPAYIIYTSGSTGRPKGVIVRHSGVSNYIQWRLSYYDFSDQDVTLQLAPFYFDTFGSNCYAALFSGGCLVLVTDDEKLDVRKVQEVMVDTKVSNFCITPRLYGALLEAGDDSALGHLRFVVLAGEKTSDLLIKKSQSMCPNVILYNEYGPTEASVAVTCHKGMNVGETALIGKPIDNTEVYVLGPENTLQPPGAVGELCVSGIGLASGYLNNPELTKRKFVNNPLFPGKKLYRTGDLARWTYDGNLEFLGRQDDQIKIRGNRIEIGEIENQLRKHDAISDVAVLAQKEGNGVILVSYFVSNESLTDEQLAGYLRKYLPDYMVPSFYVSMKELPVTSRGKLDKKALPDPKETLAVQETGDLNSWEKGLIEILSEILELETSQINLNKSFFSLGGDSLKAIAMVAQIEKKLNTSLEFGFVFEAKSLKEISDAISLLNLSNIEVAHHNKTVI